MAEIVLGLDFGSSYVSIIKKDVGLILKEPNVIAVKKDSNNSFVIEEIGEKAKTMLGKTDNRFAVFCPVNNGEIVSEKYASLVLSHFLTKLNIKRSLFTRLKFVVTIPVGISEEEKQKYINLCYSVGAKQVVCIPKIYASALGENINIGANNAKLVVDIGGGTVECAVINLNSIISGSTLCIGGKTMDATIVDYVKHKYNTLIGENTAENLKQQIGSLYPNDLATMDVSGVNLSDNTPVLISVSAKDIFEATHLFFDEIIKVVRTTINSLSPEISSDVVRNGIYVCGGYAKTVGLDKYIKNMLGVNVFVSFDCENSLTKGLTKLLAHDDLLENILTKL